MDCPIAQSGEYVRTHRVLYGHPPPRSGGSTRCPCIPSPQSSASGGDGDCVEFAAHGKGVAIRHSKALNGPALLFTHSEIAALLAGAKAGEFDHLTRG
ncbi:DUF397 domain-containing protein [Streptomyces sp. NPDC016566]|uniref:DUF397 domain-containing protein n=1 Tax=Streptomyces sp. NPDC016566 TaxID=3364967 RepID=UPI0036F8DFF9